MTERERWIVYPLLFLALGAALRDKLSEHTKTKTIECQELIVYGEEVAGQPPVPLVQIGAMKRTSADSPHLGQILVSGLIQADAMQADNIQAAKINGGNYFFHSVPFAPLLRGIPGMSPADWLRAQQQQQQAAQDDAQAHDAPAEGDKPAPSPDDAPPEEKQTESSAGASPPAE